MPVTKDQLSGIASAFLTAFDALSVEGHVNLRAPVCVHVFAPASLEIPSKSNDEFTNHLSKNLVPLLLAFPVTAYETHVHSTPTGGQITIWATGTPEFRKEVVDGEKEEWEYKGEHIFVLDVNEEGKIKRILEFLDSKGTERLRGLMGRARRKLGEGGEAW